MLTPDTRFGKLPGENAHLKGKQQALLPRGRTLNLDLHCLGRRACVHGEYAMEMVARMHRGRGLPFTTIGTSLASDREAMGDVSGPRLQTCRLVAFDVRAQRRNYHAASSCQVVALYRRVCRCCPLIGTTEAVP